MAVEDEIEKSDALDTALSKARVDPKGGRLVYGSPVVRHTLCLRRDVFACAALTDCASNTR